MKNNIKLSADTIIVLRKLARVSKMDCWFFINDDGTIFDLENNSAVMNTCEAIYMLMDGASSQDLDCLNDSEKKTIISMFLNILKQLINVR